jgi:hypothetical protein
VSLCVLERQRVIVSTIKRSKKRIAFWGWREWGLWSNRVLENRAGESSTWVFLLHFILFFFFLCFPFSFMFLSPFSPTPWFLFHVLKRT